LASNATVLKTIAPTLSDAQTVVLKPTNVAKKRVISSAIQRLWAPKACGLKALPLFISTKTNSKTGKPNVMKNFIHTLHRKPKLLSKQSALLPPSILNPPVANTEAAKNDNYHAHMLFTRFHK
jgi:hypothetical protein